MSLTKSTVSDEPATEKNVYAQEKESSDKELQGNDSIKLDKYGFLLVPQPSQFKDDPLNWPRWLKWTVLIQVSLMAFLGPFNPAVINPSLVSLAEAFGVDTTKAAYNTTTAIILGGVSSFLWTPLTNVYGRRPITLVAMLLAVIGSIGSAVSPTFKILLVTRAINGFGFGGMMSVGTAVVNDMFFLHERGEKTGVYTIFITNGAHFAVLVGGYLAQAGGWQWDFWLPAVLTGTLLLISFFLFPETLFNRSPTFIANRPTSATRTYFQLLFSPISSHIPDRKLHASDFLQSFRMLKYPSITFPFIYYTMAWTYVNVLPAVTLAEIYSKEYHMKSGPIGLSLGLSLIIGGVLGEMSAGKLSDYMVYRLAKRNGGIRKPEHRLYLSFLSAVFMPFGMVIFGLCLEKKKGFVAPLVGLSISEYGLQILSTILYAYISDTYKPQTPESGNLFNLGRGLSFTVGYYALKYANESGYAAAWGTFAAVLVVCFLPIVALMVWGEEWRRKLGRPEWNRFM